MIQLIPKPLSMARASTAARLLITALICCLPGIQDLQAQESLLSGEVLPMGDWLEFKETTHTGEPILLHLRMGYERAVLMPEPVRLQNSNRRLPGCEIYIDNDVIGFYPTIGFGRESVLFVGLESGEIYELRVRSSTLGFRQPLKINR